MKKVYKKPEIVFVSFELSESIAAGCEHISNAVQYQCAVTDPEIGISYLMDKSICEYTTPNPDDTVCYHAPSDSSNVFSS